MTRAPRTGIYCRSATEDQSHPASNVAVQQAELTAYCVKMGWQVVKCCLDQAISGHCFERPALNELLAAVKTKPRRFDIILVRDFSRLGRSIIAQRQIVKIIKGAGIEIRTPQSEQISSYWPYFVDKNFL
ncbi:MULTISPECIES: recombinase family protein [Mesorhizobium]|uniref:recombinase family protein n=1 Tax=Mesorhizobium jarvisii TaxID=1777867 RepID=UPI0009F45EB4|nr:hypothetical protein MCHK_09820 [Mesorhizobium huakuii 7653R]